MIIIGNNRERKFYWDARYNLVCDLDYSLNKKIKNHMTCNFSAKSSWLSEMMRWKIKLQ